MKIKSRIKKHAQYSELVTQRKWHQVEGSWYQRRWTVWAYTWGLALHQRCDLHAICSMLERTSQAFNNVVDLKTSITRNIRATYRKWHQVEGLWYQRHWTVWAYTWGLAPYQRCDLHANCSMLEGTSQALNNAFDLKVSISWKIRAICRGLLTNRVSQGSPILLPLQGSPTKGLRLRSSVWT